MFKHQSLLIATDCSNTAIALEIFARENGFRVKLAGNAEIAQKEISQEKPDFLLVDTDIPPKGGHALCFALKQAGILPRTILTGIEVRDIDHKRALALGALAYLPKPFSLSELQAILRTEEDSNVT